MPTPSPDFSIQKIVHRHDLLGWLYISHIPPPDDSLALHVSLKKTYDNVGMGEPETPHYAVFDMEGSLEHGMAIYSKSKGYGIVGNIAFTLGRYTAVRVAFRTPKRVNGYRLYYKIDVLFPTQSVVMNKEIREEAQAWEKRHPGFVLRVVEEW